MSKLELCCELGNTLLEIKEMVNSGKIVNLNLLNYEIDWSLKYLMMLLEK